MLREMYLNTTRGLFGNHLDINFYSLRINGKLLQFEQKVNQHFVSYCEYVLVNDFINHLL